MASTKKSREENEKKKKQKNGVKESTKKSDVKSPKKENKGIKKSNNGRESETKVVLTDGSEEQSQTPKKISHKDQVTNGNGSKPKKSEKKRKGEEKDEEFENGKEDPKLCRFPMNRIKRMVSDENPALKIKQEALFLVNKATEKFLEQFCEEAYEFSVRDRRKSLGYKQLASVVSQERRFDFLSDFVPQKVRAEDALAERKLAEIGQGEES